MSSEKLPSVVILHYSCPPVVGGVEEVVRQQAAVLARHGHKVVVVAGAGAVFRKDVPVVVDAIFRSQHPERTDVWRRPGALAELSSLVTARLAELCDEFDIVLAHNVFTMQYNLPLTYALRAYARRRSGHVVAWCHDSPYFYPDHPSYLDEEPWTVLKKPAEGVRYVAISEYRREQFSNLLGNHTDIEVIPDGVDPIRFFRLAPESVKLIAEQRLFAKGLVLVQPSRLHPRKNIELSVKVLAELTAFGEDAVLLLTGAYDPHEPASAEYATSIRRLAEELGVSDRLIIAANYVFADGSKLDASRITIRDLYLISDVLFLPSREEGFGVPVLEAGMIKLPVVCSSIPPFLETTGNDVLLFDLDEEPASIAQRMVDFLNGLPTARLFRRVLNHYVWDRIYELKLRPFMEELLTG